MKRGKTDAEEVKKEHEKGKSASNECHYSVELLPVSGEPSALRPGYLCQRMQLFTFKNVSSIRKSTDGVRRHSGK